MRPAGTIRPMTTSSQPFWTNLSRAAVSFSADCRRSKNRVMGPRPPRPAANVTRSPTSAPAMDSQHDEYEVQLPAVTASAAPAPTTAPVGRMGTIDPTSTPPKITGYPMDGGMTPVDPEEPAHFIHSTERPRRGS